MPGRTWRPRSCWYHRTAPSEGTKPYRRRVNLAELPAQTTRTLPRYPVVPATLLGRLAVDRRYQGRGYGRYLLADALFRSMRSEIASFAVIVDAKDGNARRFYERESFLPFPGQEMRLFRPMADIAKLYEKELQ
jgi:GNAT superfamily N-acetyltransferase